MFDRERFINDLRELATKDVPWVHKGRSLNGMDCIAPPRYAVEKQGFCLPEELLKDFDNYHRPPNGRHFLATMRKWFTEISESELRPADLIVFFVRKNPCHLAIQMPEGIAEAFESREGATSKFLIRPRDPSQRIAACFRIEL